MLQAQTDNTFPDLIVVCQLFHPELISTGQTLTELVEELSGLGLKILVISAQPTVIPGSSRVPCVMAHRGITIRRTWSTRFRKTSAVGKMCNLATYFASAFWFVFRHGRSSQLLLLTNPPYLPLLGWAMSLLRRQVFGVVLFDIMPEQAELVGFIKPNGIIARLWRWFNGLWYRRCSYVVALSSDMVEGALKNAPPAENLWI